MNLSCMNFTSHGKYDRHVTPSHTTMINACCTSLTVIRDRFGPGTAHTGLSVTVLCSPLPLCTDTEAAMSHETRAMLSERSLETCPGDISAWGWAAERTAAPRHTTGFTAKEQKKNNLNLYYKKSSCITVLLVLLSYLICIIIPAQLFHLEATRQLVIKAYN